MQYFPTLINCTLLLRVAGFFKIFYSLSNRIFCKQTVETLIKRRVLWRLIWVCTVCICPTKRTLGLKADATLLALFRALTVDEESVINLE